MRIHFPRKSRFRRYLTAKNYLYLLLAVVVLGSVYPLTADFYTKAEPREALVARTMMEEGEYVLPQVYGEETAYKPPMFHWFEVAATLFTGGEVTPLSARLPSAVALFVLAAGLFLFLSQRRPIPLALLASLIFLTTLDPHRYGITARVDMLVTMFIVLALFGLYRWDEAREHRGLPWGAILLMSGAFLTKGPVGVALPLLIFLVFGLVRRYPVGRLLLKLVAVGLLASVIPLVWYLLAWQKGGEDFLQIVLNENILRFLGFEDDTLFYKLGHEGKFYKPLVYFFLGLIPWTFVVLFGRWQGGMFKSLRDKPLALFALVASVTTLVFYMIPMSKSSAYLLPMYPFAALWVAETLYDLARDGSHRRLQGYVALVFAAAALLLVAVILLHAGVDPSSVGLPRLDLFAEGLRLHFGLTLFGELLLVVGLLTILYQTVRKNYTKLLFATVFLVFIVHFVIDVPVMTHYKETNSARPFAREVRTTVGSEPLYVISDLRDGFFNLYGLAFYSEIRPVEFKVAKPDEGWLVIWEKDLDRLKETALQGYVPEVVKTDTRSIKEGGRAMLLYVRKKDLK